jgi:hypothetical protein
LAGCAQPMWVKPGASQSDFSSDRYTCLQESQQRIAAAQVNVYGGAAINRVQTNEQLFASCMNAHGWYLQRQAMGQQQAAQMQPNPLKEASDTFMAELTARCQEPELQPYFAKTSCNALDATLEQLTDSSTITEPQKIALQKNRSEYLEQSRKFIQALRQYGGQKGNAIASLREKIGDQGDAVMLDLYAGKITWGEYNRRRKELAVQGRDKMNEISNSK